MSVADLITRKGAYSREVSADTISSSLMPCHSVRKLFKMSGSRVSAVPMGRSICSGVGGLTTVPTARGALRMNQGCAWMRSICESYELSDKCWECLRQTVMRLAGSTSSIRLIKSFASEGRSGGMLNLPTLTFCSRVRMFSSSKGSRPVKSAKRIMPQDQMSEEEPWYVRPCKS